MHMFVFNFSVPVTGTPASPDSYSQAVAIFAKPVYYNACILEFIALGFIAMPIAMTAKTLKRERERARQYDREAVAVSEGYMHVERAQVPPPPPPPVRVPAPPTARVVLPPATAVPPRPSAPPPCPSVAPPMPLTLPAPSGAPPMPSTLTAASVARAMPSTLTAPSGAPPMPSAPSVARASELHHSKASYIIQMAAQMAAETVMAANAAAAASSSTQPSSVPTVAANAAAAASSLTQPSSVPTVPMSDDDDDDDAGTVNSPVNDVARSVSLTPENPDVVTADTYLHIVRVLETIPDRGTSTVHLVSYGRLQVGYDEIERKVHNWTDAEVPRHQLGNKDWETRGCTGLNGRILMSLAMHPQFTELIGHAKRCIKRKDSPIVFQCARTPSYIPVVGLHTIQSSHTLNNFKK